MHASVGDGCHTVPYGKMTSPERDKPRSLRKDGFAGTGQAPSPQKACHCE